MTHRLPTYFVSHGGGPWPWMKQEVGPAYAVLEASLVDMRRQIGVRPKAILVVTSHWETAGFMVSSGTAPGMIYDYGGFPPHTYQIRYPAPGDPPVRLQLPERPAAAPADGATPGPQSQRVDVRVQLAGAVPPGTTVTTRTQDGGVRVERSMLGSQP